MQRLVVISAIVAVSIVLVAGSAFAGQCPKLVAQINAEVGNRFDATANAAKAKAAQALTLHTEGKHADSEKLAKETLVSLGKKM